MEQQQPIATIEKTRLVPFAQIPNEVICALDMSTDSKWILIYLLSKPQGWQLRKADLMKHGLLKPGEVRNALRQLKSLGYLKSEVKSLGRPRLDGTGGGYHTTWYVSHARDFTSLENTSGKNTPDVNTLDVNTLDVNTLDVNTSGVKNAPLVIKNRNNTEEERNTEKEINPPNPPLLGGVLQEIEIEEPKPNSKKKKAGKSTSPSSAFNPEQEKLFLDVWEKYKRTSFSGMEKLNPDHAAVIEKAVGQNGLTITEFVPYFEEFVKACGRLDFVQWYEEGNKAPHLRNCLTKGKAFDLVETAIRITKHKEEEAKKKAEFDKESSVRIKELLEQLERDKAAGIPSPSSLEDLNYTGRKLSSDSIATQKPVIDDEDDDAPCYGNRHKFTWTRNPAMTNREQASSFDGPDLFDEPKTEGEIDF